MRFQRIVICSYLLQVQLQVQLSSAERIPWSSVTSSRSRSRRMPLAHTMDPGVASLVTDNDNEEDEKEIVVKKFGLFGAPTRKSLKIDVDIDDKINDEATGTVAATEDSGTGTGTGAGAGAKVIDDSDDNDEDGGEIIGEEKQDEDGVEEKEPESVKKFGMFGRRKNSKVETVDNNDEVEAEETEAEIDCDGEDEIEGDDEKDPTSNGRKFSLFGGMRKAIQTDLTVDADQDIRARDGSEVAEKSVSTPEEQGTGGRFGVFARKSKSKGRMANTVTTDVNEDSDAVIDPDATEEKNETGEEKENVAAESEIESVKKEPKPRFGFFGGRNKVTTDEDKKVNADANDVDKNEEIKDETTTIHEDYNSEKTITKEQNTRGKIGFFGSKKEETEVTVSMPDVNEEPDEDDVVNDTLDNVEENEELEEESTAVSDTDSAKESNTNTGGSFGFFGRRKKEALVIPNINDEPDYIEAREMVAPIEEESIADDDGKESVDNFPEVSDELLGGDKPIVDLPAEIGAKTLLVEEKKKKVITVSAESEPITVNVTTRTDDDDDGDGKDDLKVSQSAEKEEDISITKQRPTGLGGLFKQPKRRLFPFGKKTPDAKEVKSVEDEIDNKSTDTDKDVSGDELGEEDDTDISKEKENDQELAGNSTVPVVDKKSTDEKELEATIQALINEVMSSQEGGEADKSSQTSESSVGKDPSIKSEADDETAKKRKEESAKNPKKKESKKKKVKGDFSPSRALHNAFPWLKDKESEGDNGDDPPSPEVQPSVDPNANPNPPQQQALPVGMPFSPFGPPTGPVIIPLSPGRGRQRFPPGIPPSPLSPTSRDATMTNIIASLLPLLSRLAVLTLLSSSALLGHSEIYSPKPSQHFMLERLNDRYEKDGLAMKRALEHPPHKKQKSVWSIVLSGRKGALKKSMAKSDKDSKKLADLYSRTVIVMDIQTMTNDVEKVVEELRDAVSYILRQYNDKTTRLDMGKDLEVVVCVESPGGVVHDFGLAADQLARLRESGKENSDISLTVCVDKVAASGGYLMACQASPGQLFAAPYAVIGSIGVLRETINVHDILEKYGVRPLLLTAGDAKAPLTMTNKVTEDNLELVQKNLERVHEAFRDTVSTNRGDAISESFDKVTSGDVFLGKDAVGCGLVDSLKTSDEYIFERIQAGDRVLRLHKYDKNRINIHFSPLDLLLLKSDGRMGKAVQTLIRIGSQAMKVGGLVGAIKLVDQNYQASNRRRLQDDI